MTLKKVAIKKNKDNFYIPKIVSVVFVTFLLVTIISLFRLSQINLDTCIHQDIQVLQKIFNQIQQDCYISKFSHEKNYIDFLNVINFSGNTVGSMEIMFPQHWKGPYLDKNLTAQDRSYMILKNKQGYFIVPGDGVKLASGVVLGKDLILNQNSDMASLIKNSNALGPQTGMLAAKINIGTDFFKNITQNNVLALGGMD